MTRTGVGSGIHLLSVLLVLENDGDVLCMVQELWVGVQEYSTRGGPKYEASYSHSLGSTQRDGFRVLAGSHCEEESAKDEIRDVGEGEASVRC